MFFCEKVYCQQFFYSSSLGNIFDFCVVFNSFEILGHCPRIVLRFFNATYIARWLRGSWGLQPPSNVKKIGRGVGRERKNCFDLKSPTGNSCVYLFELFKSLPTKALSTLQFIAKQIKRVLGASKVGVADVLLRICPEANSQIGIWIAPKKMLS